MNNIINCIIFYQVLNYKFSLHGAPLSTFSSKRNDNVVVVGHASYHLLGSTLLL
uniref:Uncharacterized protein n=1 Tax=Arion vulgaris TaxID=1028688 RepID=A0A0B7BQZ7_9EUPU